MTIEQIENYKPLLAECYAADLDLINKWHTTKGLEECVEKEFADLQHAKVTMFKVVKNDMLAGYFCKELFSGRDFLTGFFLMPKFRTKYFKKKYWALICGEFRKPFFCGLYENNIPANKFIVNRGGSLIVQANLPDGLANYFKIEV